MKVESARNIFFLQKGKQGHLLQDLKVPGSNLDKKVPGSNLDKEYKFIELVILTSDKPTIEM